MNQLVPRRKRQRPDKYASASESLTMLELHEALALLVDRAGRQPIVDVPLANALGLALAEDVFADRDSPPFAKSMVDGYAVADIDMLKGVVKLPCVDEIAAGMSSSCPLKPGTTVRIMTGAPVPDGTGGVVMVERSTPLGESRVRLEVSPYRPGQNIMPRACELSAHQVALKAGSHIGAAECAILATVGCVRPKVYRRPSLAVITTGDEIVAPDQTPRGAQIRNSNEATIAALAHRFGIEAVTLGIAGDTTAQLEKLVESGLKADVLILSGGVSAGVRDLVPGVLQAAGVERVFHKVAFKPGKPVWFGTHRGGLVFGLPGNPVSVLVCFELFVATALRVRMGFANARPVHLRLPLAEDVEQNSERLTYHPAKLNHDVAGTTVSLVDWHGSPDMRSLTDADGFAVLPGGPIKLQRGAVVEFLILRD